MYVEVGFALQSSARVNSDTYILNAWKFLELHVRSIGKPKAAKLTTITCSLLDRVFDYDKDKAINRYPFNSEVIATPSPLRSR